MSCTQCSNLITKLKTIMSLRNNDKPNTLNPINLSSCQKFECQISIFSSYHKFLSTSEDMKIPIDIISFKQNIFLQLIKNLIDNMPQRELPLEIINDWGETNLLFGNLGQLFESDPSQLNEFTLNLFDSLQKYFDAFFSLEKSLITQNLFIFEKQVDFIINFQQNLFESGHYSLSLKSIRLLLIFRKYKNLLLDRKLLAKCTLKVHFAILAKKAENTLDYILKLEVAVLLLSSYIFWGITTTSLNIDHLDKIYSICADIRGNKGVDTKAVEKINHEIFLNGVFSPKDFLKWCVTLIITANTQFDWYIVTEVWMALSSIELKETARDLLSLVYNLCSHKNMGKKQLLKCIRFLLLFSDFKESPEKAKKLCNAILSDDFFNIFICNNSFLSDLLNSDPSLFEVCFEGFIKHPAFADFSSLKNLEAFLAKWTYSHLKIILKNLKTFQRIALTKHFRLKQVRVFESVSKVCLEHLLKFKQLNLESRRNKSNLNVQNSLVRLCLLFASLMSDIELKKLGSFLFMSFRKGELGVFNESIYNLEEALRICPHLASLFGEYCTKISLQNIQTALDTQNENSKFIVWWALSRFLTKSQFTFSTKIVPSISQYIAFLKEYNNSKMAIFHKNLKSKRPYENNLKSDLDAKMGQTLKRFAEMTEKIASEFGIERMVFEFNEEMTSLPTEGKKKIEKNLRWKNASLSYRTKS